MSRIWLCTLVGVASVALMVPAQAQETFSTARMGMEAAAAKGDYATAYEAARKIMQMEHQAQAGTLTAEDQYAVGLAYSYLAAQAFDQALQSGKLNDEQTALAMKLRGQVIPTATTQEELPEKLRVVAKGERIDLEEYLVAGKTTIVDFYSEYCGPCRTLAPRLEELANQREDVYVVKVDINRPGQVGIDWQSPVARQFNLQSIPHLKVYGPDKQLIAEGRPALTQVLQWCEVR